MGIMISREIVQTRTWIDPANPNPQLPDFNFNFTYPITLFDAVLSDYGPEPYTLRKAIGVLESLIKERQPMFEAGSSNDVVTWTEERGKLGKLPVTRSFHIRPDQRSADRLVTELTIGAYIDTKTPLDSYNAHVADIKPNQKSVHITDEERTYWNGMTALDQFRKHTADKTVHTTSEEKAAWNAKLDAKAFDDHVKDYSNPHHVTTGQINTFTREEIIQLISDSQPKFFNYKNIAWDVVNGTFKLELYQAKNWDPNYILDHRYNQNYWTDPHGIMPDGTEFTIDQDTLRFLPDLNAGQRYFALVAKLPPSVDARHSEVLIYFKDETSPWVEVSTAVTNNGDLFITYPDRRLYLWVGGQFVEMMTTSILTGDQNTGTPDHNTKDNLIASQFRIVAGTDNVTYNGETHTAKVEYENDMITVGRAGTITVYYDGGYSPPIKAGTYKVSVTTSGGTAYNPVKVPLEIGSLLIQPKQITYSVEIADKVYDGTDLASYAVEPSLVGMVPSDIVGLLPDQAHFAEINVGTNLSVKLPMMKLTGPSSSNYTLQQPDGIVANITQKPLTIINLEATSRSYNQTNVVKLTGGQLVGVVQIDAGKVAMTIPGTGTTANPDVGFGLPVMIDPIVLTGDRSTNYMLIQPTNITVTISVIRVKISGLSVSNKVYDGTTDCSVVGTAIIDGRLGDDDVSVVPGTAVFVSKNVGQKTAIFNNYAIAGTLSKNYLLTNQPEMVQAMITARPVTLTGVTAVNRAYDGTCIVGLSGGTIINGIATDNVTINLGVGTTLTPRAGFSKAVSTVISLSGTASGNYELKQPSDIAVDIARKVIRITGVRAVDRNYNGTFLVELIGGELLGVVGADRVDFTLGKGKVDSIDVGVNKPVTTSIKLGGVEAENYNLEQPNGITVSISA